MISVIIPVYNDKRVENTIKSLKNNSYSEYEVILVDNNSTDSSIKEIAEKHEIKYILAKQPSSYIARNKGAELAQGDILVFLDSDCVVADNFLQNIFKAFEENIDGLMGKINGINKNKTAEMEQRFYEEITADFLNNEQKRLTRIDTRNFAIKKQVFEKLKGFNTELKFGGDMEFGARLHDGNFNIVYNDQVIVEHENETKIYRIIKKRIRQNADNRNIVKHHDQEFIKKYFPHLIFYPKNILTTILRIWFALWLLCNYPFFQINLFILPGNLKYLYFKGINVLAIKYGMLSNYGF